MIKLILGLKGSGKTKYLIDNIEEAVKTSEGCVVASNAAQPFVST